MNKISLLVLALLGLAQMDQAQAQDLQCTLRTDGSSICINDHVIDYRKMDGTVTAIYADNTAVVQYSATESNLMDIQQLAREVPCLYGFCASDRVLDDDGYAGWINYVYENGIAEVGYPNGETWVLTLNELRVANGSVDYPRTWPTPRSYPDVIVIVQWPFPVRPYYLPYQWPYGYPYGYPTGYHPIHPCHPIRPIYVGNHPIPHYPYHPVAYPNHRPIPHPVPGPRPHPNTGGPRNPNGGPVPPTHTGPRHPPTNPGRTNPTNPGRTNPSPGRTNPSPGRTNPSPSRPSPSRPSPSRPSPSRPSPSRPSPSRPSTSPSRPSPSRPSTSPSRSSPSRPSSSPSRSSPSRSSGGASPSRSSPSRSSGGSSPSRSSGGSRPSGGRHLNVSAM